MVEVSPELEALIAGMTDEEFAVLVAKTRAPDTSEKFREVVKSVAPRHVKEFIKVANVAAFVGADGTVDEARLRQNLATLFGVPNGQQAPPNWGQTGSFSSAAPGDGGRAQAQRRAEQNGRAGTAAGREALRHMSVGVENGGAAEARRRAAKKER